MFDLSTNNKHCIESRSEQLFVNGVQIVNFASSEPRRKRNNTRKLFSRDNKKLIETIHGKGFNTSEFQRNFIFPVWHKKTLISALFPLYKHKKVKKTWEVEQNKAMETFLFDMPLNLEGNWLKGLTTSPVQFSIFKITQVFNKYVYMRRKVFGKTLNFSLE